MQWLTLPPHYLLQHPQYPSISSTSENCTSSIKEQHPFPMCQHSLAWSCPGLLLQVCLATQVFISFTLALFQTIPQKHLGHTVLHFPLHDQYSLSPDTHKVYSVPLLRSLVQLLLPWKSSWVSLHRSMTFYPEFINGYPIFLSAFFLN